MAIQADTFNTIHPSEQQRIDYQRYQANPVPNPWDDPNSPEFNAPQQEPVGLRTIAEITEAQANYESQAARLNQEIQKVRQGGTSEIISPTGPGGTFTVDPTFMAGLVEARNTFRPPTPGDTTAQNPNFRNIQIPALGGNVQLEYRPPGNRGAGGWIFTGLGNSPVGNNPGGLHHDIQNQEFKPFKNRDITFPMRPELLDPYKNTESLPKYNLERAMTDNTEPPLGWLDTVDRFGNKPQGGHQLEQAEMLGKIRERSPEEIKILNDQLIAGNWKPLYLPGTSGAQASHAIEQVGQNWFGPTWGPEGSGNLWLEAWE